MPNTPKVLLYSVLIVCYSKLHCRSPSCSDALVRSEDSSQRAKLVATVLVLKRISDSLLFDISTTIWFVLNLQ